MKLHPNEIVLNTLSEDERTLLELTAADLGKKYVQALNEQKQRQR